MKQYIQARPVQMVISVQLGYYFKIRAYEMSSELQRTGKCEIQSYFKHINLRIYLLSIKITFIANSHLTICT